MSIYIEGMILRNIKLRIAVKIIPLYFEFIYDNLFTIYTSVIALLRKI